MTKSHDTKRTRFARLVGAVLAGLVALACAPTIVPLTLTPTMTTTASVFAEVATTTPLPPPTVTPTVESLALPTPLPTETPPPTPTPTGAWLPGDLRVFPGPLHYDGDLLSIEVLVSNISTLPPDSPASLSVDGVEVSPVQPVVINSVLRDNLLLFRWFWDTTGYAGRHRLTVYVPVNEAGDVQEIVTYIEILPADLRPPSEQAAAWQQLETFCCRLNYLSVTAAGRDIDQIADVSRDGIAHVEEQMGFAIPDKPIPITLIDNVWGNGAFAGGELVVSYVDRPYTGFDLETVIRHEATHWAARSLSKEAPTILVEGIAVYVAGGHYKPEPLPQRAAALLELDAYIPLAELADHFRSQQHEIAYLEAGALVAYLSETYTWPQFLVLYSADVDGRGSNWLDRAFSLIYRKDLAGIESDFIAWLESQDAADQADDLRLTIALHDTARRYQAQYAPYQENLPLQQAVEAGLTADFLREPTAPQNLALETMLVAAQQALDEGLAFTAEMLLEAVNATLGDGDFTRGLVSDYLAIANLLLEQGYEAQRINIAGNHATVEGIRDWPELETLELIKLDGEWQVAD